VFFDISDSPYNLILYHTFHIIDSSLSQSVVIDPTIYSVILGMTMELNNSDAGLTKICC